MSETTSRHCGVVLIVEDEIGIADTLRYALTSEGYTVVHVTTGKGALECIATTPPLCMILDVGLPDMSGFDLCREIRRAHSFPVLFLSARDDSIDKIVGLELGADDYVAKPFSPREVVARVRALLRRERMAQGESTTSDGGTAPRTKCHEHQLFEVIEARKEIYFLGQSLELSRYEYRLLEKLIRSPGRVFSREQLMLAVWDDPSSSMERTVDAHIKSIRQVLRRVAPEMEIIITHRGFGYSLELPTSRGVHT